MVAEGTLDLAGAPHQGRLCRWPADCENLRHQAHHRAGLDVADALDHRLRDPADLGHRHVQACGQQVGDLELPGSLQKVAPIVATPTKEGAVFSFTWLSYTGSGMLIAAIISGLLMGFSPAGLVVAYGRTIKVCAYSLVTISAMLAIGTLTRLSGIDATLGLAFAATGVLYPFFGTLLGWLGVALTGSDTASNILFGNLQKITSEQLGISPILMSAANSSGGVMGKMIDAQSIVVASTATNWFGHEGTILRFVFWHSIVLASLVGCLVMLQAYVFTGMIVH
jgi:lactate permease